MKKTLFLAAALGALFTFSCQKPEANTPGGGDDKTPSGKTLAAPALQADKTAVTLDEASAAQEALKLTWTSGLSEGDNEPVSYTLYANAEGKDLFTDPQKFEAGKALQKAFTGEQLNSLAAKLGISEEGKIVFGVYAVADKGTYESQLSNKVSVTVTLYKATFEGPDALYLVGAATPYGWDLSQALELPNDGNNVYKASEVPLRVLPQSLNAGFKLYFSRGGDGEDPRFIGQDPASENFGDAIIVEEGMQDTQFLPAPAGYTNGVYDIEANLNDLKVKITRKGDLPEVQLPEKLYMVGGCFEWGWTAAECTTLDKVSDKKYEAKGIKMAFGTNENPLGFKVWLGPDTYSPYFAMAADATKENVKILLVEDSDAPQFYPGKLGYESGTYDIAMDFNSMVATFTLIESAPAFPEKLYLLGGCFSSDWQYSDDFVLNSVSEGVYQASGIVFTGMEDWNGFKIYSGLEWAGPWYGMDLDNSTHDNIILVDGDKYLSATDKADTQVYLGLLGYTEVGKYTITADLNAMKLTAVPETGSVDPLTGLSKIYLSGGLFAEDWNSWDFREDRVLTVVSSGVFEGQAYLYLDHEGRGFKLFGQADWGPKVWSADLESGSELKILEEDNEQFYPFRFGYTSGTYTIRADFNQMKLILNKQQ